ncbi:MAG: LEA type 2 family protein [Chitinophagales bacterium]|nr:LEA type 2 family protein [Chitinophagales bacterium]
MKWQKFLREWLRTFIQKRIGKLLKLNNLWKLDQLEYIKTTISYVLFENKAFVINNFLIPVRLEGIHFDIFNKELKIGEVIYENTTRLPSGSKKYVNIDVKMNHITAIFSFLRLFIIREIAVEVKGDIHLKILGMHFFVPIADTVSIPKEKIKILMQKKELADQKAISDAEIIEDENDENTLIEEAFVENPMVDISLEEEKHPIKDEMDISDIIKAESIIDDNPPPKDISSTSQDSEKSANEPDSSDGHSS